MVQRYFGCLAFALMLALSLVTNTEERNRDIPLVHVADPNIDLSPRYDPLEWLYPIPIRFHLPLQLAEGPFVEFTNRKIQIAGNDDIRPYLFGERLESLVVGDLFLGMNSFGMFSASFDLRVSGPGVALHWFPMEGLYCSFRLELLRGNVTVTTTLIP